jgi:hypothetical protein
VHLGAAVPGSLPAMRSWGKVGLYWRRGRSGGPGPYRWLAVRGLSNGGEAGTGRGRAGHGDIGGFLADIVSL